MLGDRLKAAREKLGITQTAAAKAADVARVYLSNVEHGKKVPTVYVFLRLCRALKVSPAKIIKEVETDVRRQENLDRKIAKL
jgi:transcriptional regulator with XRE-family HTH domain